MAFYRKNIGGVQQLVRIVLGAAATIAAVFYLTGANQWLAVAAGLTFALTGIVGYCPACAVLRTSRPDGS